MPAIKLGALQKFSKLVQCNIKSLKGQVCAGPGGREHRLKFPSLSIIPRKFDFNPMQADSLNPKTGKDYGANSATQDIYHVGTWEGFVELRLGTKTASQRYSIQEAIEKLFLGGVTYESAGFEASYETQILHPGVLWVDLPECHDARIIFELLDERWANERVYSKEWYTHITVRMIIPALVCTKAAPCLETIDLKLTEDLETLIVDEDSIPEDTESFIIDQP